MSIRVRRADNSDLTYIVSLAKRESEAIGFVPASRYESMATGFGDTRPSNRLWVAEEDAERVGFLYATPGEPGGAVTVIQVCVSEDARRLEFGTALVAEAENYARSIQRGAVRLSVATDLEASRFWESEGYRLDRIDAGGKRRGRLLERRSKCLPCGLFVEVTA